MLKSIQIFRHLPQFANSQQKTRYKRRELAFHKRGSTMDNKYIKILMTEEIHMKMMIYLLFYTLLYGF